MVSPHELSTTNKARNDRLISNLKRYNVAARRTNTTTLLTSEILKSLKTELSRILP
jgi:hypothetical protein